MEKLSLGIFTGAFTPEENKRYSFKARGAAAAVELAQLVYNGISTVFFKSSEGYASIADNYMSWTFHAPKDFKTTAYGSTALNCQYIYNAGKNMTVSDFFEALANATRYDGGDGVEVAGWESAMRTLQLAEDKVNTTLNQFDGVAIYNVNNSLDEIFNFGSFEAPSGTKNLFSNFMRWLNSALSEEDGRVLKLPAYYFLDNYNNSSKTPTSFRMGLEFMNDYEPIARMTFTFADYEE